MNPAWCLFIFILLQSSSVMKDIFFREERALRHKGAAVPGGCGQGEKVVRQG